MAAHYCLLAAFAIAYCTESAEFPQDKIHMNRLETLLSRNRWFLCKRSEMKRGKCWPITEALKKTDDQRLRSGLQRRGKSLRRRRQLQKDPCLPNEENENMTKLGRNQPSRGVAWRSDQRCAPRPDDCSFLLEGERSFRGIINFRCSFIFLSNCSLGPALRRGGAAACPRAGGPRGGDLASQSPNKWAEMI